MEVGVVGLGRMGLPIAARLLAAGHGLTVYNRTRARAVPLLEQGAAEVAAPGEIWATADICVTMLADDAALEAVTSGGDGLLRVQGHAGRERVLIDMSTVAVDTSERIAAAAAAVGVAYLRAPVSGNPSVVEAGNLTIMVSGPRAEFDRLETLLREIGPKVFYVGSGEQARVMKLALNLIIAGTAELLAEAIALGEAAGLGRAALLEVTAASAVGSPFVGYKSAALVAHDYETTFSAAGLKKDLGHALALAGDLGLPLPATALVRELLEACVGGGLGDIDMMALLPRLQREAGFPSDV